MMPNTSALAEMCGALPVSPEDAPGIIEAAEALKDRQAANERLSRDLIEAARDARGG